MADDKPISRRKSEHLSIVAAGAADFHATRTLLGEVDLMHQALPGLSLDEVDTSVTFLGKRLRVPIFIGAMTGGTPEARAINRDLAVAAQAEGVGLCLGSQRAMLRDGALAETYRVRDVAPDILLAGNLGVVQATELGSDGVDALRLAVGADALFIHLNPAMELVQVDGDRDFRRSGETIASLRASLGERLWVKETGCGLSARAAEALSGHGVSVVETGGAGGTSWVAVELEREGATQAAAPFREWGIPTAASVVYCSRASLTTIAGGGLRDGLDLARAIALGASAGAFAAPLLRAQREAGSSGVRRVLHRIGEELRIALALTGSRCVADLQRAPRVLGATLTRWLS